MHVYINYWIIIYCECEERENSFIVLFEINISLYDDDDNDDDIVCCDVTSSLWLM